MRHHDLHGYLSSWAQELHARSNRVRQLIGDAHWLSDGHHKEYLLRDFIQRYLSPDLLISRGFICTPSRVRKCSKEIDILISAPSIQAPLFNEGGLQIVTPRAVVGHLEIKSKCTKSNLRDALQNQTHTQRLITNPAKRASIWRGIDFYESDPSLNSTKALTWLAQMISDTVAHTQRKSPSQPTTDASYFPNCIVLNPNLLVLIGEANDTSILLRAFPVPQLSLACAIIDLLSAIVATLNDSPEMTDFDDLMETMATDAEVRTIDCN